MTAKKSSSALIVLMALGTFVVVLDNTIMNVSISALVEDLQTTVSGVQAAIALNALMMAAFVLMGGKMADITGMKKTFVAGAFIYVSGSLLASFSNSLAIFILGWCAIQGFGAAMMLPNVTTIIRANVMGAERAKAYGIIAGINALAMAAGPLIGGFLTTYYSWRWAFRLEVFVLVIVLFFSHIIPKDVLGKLRPKLDTSGVILQAIAMIFFILGLLLVADYGLFFSKQPIVVFGQTLDLFGLSVVPFLMAFGLVSLIMFINHEKKLSAKQKDVLVDLRLFSINNFVKSLNVRFWQVFLVAATTFAIPLYLQVTYGLTAFETGFVLLGFTAGLIITSIGASKFALNILPKTKVKVGFLVSISGLFLMAMYVSIGSAPIGLLPGIFIYGLGLGLVTSQIVNVVMSSVSSKQTAEASGVTSTFETLASSVGTALIGTILVVALTSGVTKMVNESTVFSPEIKDEISSEMSASIDIVSNEVISDNISENGIYEEEAIRIYDEARKNAFITVLLTMGFISFVSFLLSNNLPSVKSSEMATEA